MNWNIRRYFRFSINIDQRIVRSAQRKHHFSGAFLRAWYEKKVCVMSRCVGNTCGLNNYLGQISDREVMAVFAFCIGSDWIGLTTRVVNIQMGILAEGFYQTLQFQYPMNDRQWKWKIKKRATRKRMSGKYVFGVAVLNIGVKSMSMTISRFMLCH